MSVTAGTTYTASYFAPNGHYSYTSQGFAAAVTNGPLQAPSNATTPNGVYGYSGQNAFPTNTFNAANYWVDVLFAPVQVPGKVTNVTANAGQSSASVSWTAPTSGDAPTSYVITPFIGSTAQTPTTVTGTPPAPSATVRNLTPGTAYTFTVHAANVNGAGAESAASNAVTPTAPTAPGAPTSVATAPATGQVLVGWSDPSSDGGSSITGYTVTPFSGGTAGTPVHVTADKASATVTGLTNGTSYTFKVTATNAIGSTDSAATTAVTPDNTTFDFATPANIDSGDASATQVGVSFSSTVAGNVTGIRFYKAAANTGTHTGSLWALTGALLARAVFTNESASGWQTVLFSQPVPILPGTIYVASYFAPNGHYSYTSQGFATAVTNGPLQAVASGSTPNGVFSGSLDSFPQGTFNATNYWVDLVFTPTG